MLQGGVRRWRQLSQIVDISSIRGYLSPFLLSGIPLHLYYRQASEGVSGLHFNGLLF